MDNEQEVQVTQNEPEVATPNEEVLSAEEIADLKHKAEVSSQNFARLKKAEKELEELRAKLPKDEQKPTESPKTDTNVLSQDDMFALVSAGVKHKEDRQFIVESAKLMGVSVEDALTSKTVMSLLKEKQEERETAMATAIGGGKRASVPKVSDDTLLSQAQKGGILPDDDEGIMRLIKARKGLK